jgi:hypothetical protein
MRAIVKFYRGRFFDMHQLQRWMTRYCAHMSDIDYKLARCQDHIADLMVCIAELKEDSSGSGMLAPATLITMLQRTLEDWERHKTSLIDTKKRLEKD